MADVRNFRPPDGGEPKSREILLSMADGALWQQSGSEWIGSNWSVPGTLESLAQMERQRSLEVPMRFSSTILALQEERDKVIQQFQDDAQSRAKQSKISNTQLLRDLDEMGKALAQSRQAAKQAKRQLAQKEAEVEHLLSEKRALLKLIMEVGPRALWDWIKREIVDQGLDSREDFDRRWLAWLAATEDVKISSSLPSLSYDGLGSRKFDMDNADTQSILEEKHQCVNCNERNDRSTEAHASGKSSLLGIVFSIVLQEGMENLHYLLKKGLFFLPMAWFRFWMGMSIRITRHLVGLMSASMTVPFAI